MQRIKVKNRLITILPINKNYLPLINNQIITSKRTSLQSKQCSFNDVQLYLLKILVSHLTYNSVFLHTSAEVHFAHSKIFNITFADQKSMMIRISSFWSVVLIGCVFGQNVPISPCPDIFSYQNDGRSWKGLVTITRNLQQEQEVKLSLELSVRGAISDVSLSRFTTVFTTI